MKQTRSVDMKAAVIAAAALGLASALGAQPTQEVQQAARALARAGSYSWKTTMQFGQNRAGTLTGKYANRTAVITIPFRNQETQVVIRGRQRAVKTQEGWKSLAELEQEAQQQQGPRRFMVMMLRNLAPPHWEVRRLLRAAQSVKKEGNVYSADLSAEGARNLMSFRRRGRPGQQQQAQEREGPPAPQVENGKGWVKFWVRDGKLQKYSFHVEGTMKFGEREFPMSRTTTVELSKVGETKAEVPAEAKAKLQPR